MHGAHAPLSTDYGLEITVCKEMHWSVSDMYSAPARMIDEIVTRMNAEQKWTEKRHEVESQRHRNQQQRNSKARKKR